MKSEDIVNRISEILNEGIKLNNKKLCEVAVKYYSNVPQKGYNVYYCVMEKNNPDYLKIGMTNYDMGKPLNIDKKLLLNSSPFKHKSAANQFAEYKAKEYSVPIYNMSWQYLGQQKDFIQIIDEN